jgi:hypothetical protein
MRTSTLVLTAAVCAAGLAATAGPADACSCRVRQHHAVYRHTTYYRSGYRPYAYGYAVPAYYDAYAYDPYVDRSYDWSDAPGVSVTYGSGYRHHWRSYGYSYGGGHWHEGGHGHWDRGRHRGEG